jgi:DNA-binding response OmpR family regulator
VGHLGRHTHPGSYGRQAGRRGGRGRIRLGGLTVDAQSRQVWVDGAGVELSRTEFDLLDALIGAPRVAFTRHRLIELVWGANWLGDEHPVDVHVSSLRRKLGNADYIRTVRGVGYRMGAG